MTIGLFPEKDTGILLALPNLVAGLVSLVLIFGEQSHVFFGLCDTTSAGDWSLRLTAITVAVVPRQALPGFERHVQVLRATSQSRA